MNRIIIDVTQLVHWPGKLTGIPRVMHELAVRFAREGNPDVLFASWVKDLGEMCEIDFNATMLQRGNGIVYRRRGESWPAATTLPRSGVAVQPSRKLTVKRIAKYGLRQTARLNKRVAAALEQRAKMLTIRRYQVVDFKKGDTLFIPWGEWWDPGFIQRLKDWHKAGLRVVPLIHDVGPMVEPQYSGHSTDSLGEYVKNIVPISEPTLVVSENTRTDLVKWLRANKLTPPRIEVMRNGEDFQFSKPTKPVDPLFVRSGLKGQDYIMCVGTVELKKNHMLLYYAYKLAHARGIKLPKMLFVGRPGWHTETMLEMIATDPEVKDEILGLHDISDEELSWLYDRCLFTVLPSFYEGWGIPVAESLARGVPCACSNTSSLIEIGEGIVEHFSPYSTEECLAAIEKWLDPKALKAARARTATYKQTSWDDSYKQVKMYLE